MKFVCVKSLLFKLLLLLFTMAVNADPANTGPANTGKAISQTQTTENKTAIFAGGCFWCMETDFEQAPGVLDVISGYTGGNHADPNYADYVSKGHIEAILVSYDPSEISYQQLLEYFWMSIDPTDASGQFCDRGEQYSSAIFYLDEQQKKQSLKSRKQLENSGLLDNRVVTNVLAAGKFYPAEEEHQDYHKKNPYSYKFYRFSCRRDHRLDELWGKQVFIHPAS